MTAPASPRPPPASKSSGSGSATILEGEAPLPSRIAEAAVVATGAREARLYLRERDAWVAHGEKSLAASSRERSPSRCPRRPSSGRATSGFPCAPKARPTGSSACSTCRASESPESAPLSSAFSSARSSAAHRLARQVREAEFELKARLLELESLYDLGLSLGGQLDLSSLADEVLFRSISLTDAGKGTLVLLEDSGARAPRAERRRRGPRGAGRRGLGRCRRAASSTTPRSAMPTAGMRDGSCEKCLAVADLGAGPAAGGARRRRQGVARRPGARLHGHRRAAALALRQPGRGGHRDGAAPQGRDREGAHGAGARARRGDPAPDPPPRSAPSCPGLEIAARNVPTRQVGGDYFDLFPLSGGRLGFLVADVSGKGMPAALLVSTVHAAVHLQIDEAKTIADLIGRIDRHLQRYAATRKFLTCFFGVIEPDIGAAALRLRRATIRRCCAALGAGSSRSRPPGCRSGCSRTRAGRRRPSCSSRATCSASTRTA